MRFEQFSPDEPVKVRKATEHEMEVFIHHAAELTRFGMVPYFAPIINEIRVVMINTNKAYVDKDWRVALPEGSLDSFDAKDTPVEIIREVLRLVILQHDRAAKNVMSDEEVTRVSFDLEINQRLNGFNGRLKLNRDGEEIVDLLPEDYDLPAFGIAEEYYSTVLSYMRESEMPDMAGEDDGDENGTGNNSDSNEESDEEGNNPGANGDATDEEDDQENGTGAKTGSSKFVTEAELVAMMDAVGLQRADNQTKRRKRNDMLALVQEEMRSKSIGTGRWHAYGNRKLTGYKGREALGNSLREVLTVFVQTPCVTYVIISP